MPPAVEAIQTATRGFGAYFITHICYGDSESTYPGRLELAVDNFDLEMSNSGLEILRLFKKSAFTKDIRYGVVDVHPHVVEGRTWSSGL